MGSQLCPDHPPWPWTSCRDEKGKRRWESDREEGCTVVFPGVEGAEPTSLDVGMELSYQDKWSSRVSRDSSRGRKCTGTEQGEDPRTPLWREPPDHHTSQVWRRLQEGECRLPPTDALIHVKGTTLASCFPVSSAQPLPVCLHTGDGNELRTKD